MIKVVGGVELSRFFYPVSDELAMVEIELNNLIQSIGINHIKNIMDDIGCVRYKYLRAGIILLAAKSVEKDPSKSADTQIIHLASIMELIFHAVFVHNQIGEKNERYFDSTDIENKIAVLVGDSLYTRAFFAAAQILPVNMFRIISDLTLKMCLAEIKEEVLNDSAVSIEKYFELIEEKTAVFFSTCCKLSADLVSAGESEKIYLEKIGLNLGMLYQISVDFANVQPCLPVDFDIQKLGSFAIDAENSISYLKDSIYKNKLLELLNYFTAQIKLNH